MFELKRLSLDAVPAALEKAHRYRLLNEAMEAESICRDVLAVDPDNQEALVTLLLALTDQFEDRLAAAHEQARQALARIRGDYARLYYGGLLAERRGKAQLKRGGHQTGHGIYEWLRHAMELYERAAEVRPPGNDDAILRWNTCARVLIDHPSLVPSGEGQFQPWLE
jgi:hypothetical protein